MSKTSSHKKWISLLNHRHEKSASNISQGGSGLINSRLCSPKSIKTCSSAQRSTGSKSTSYASHASHFPKKKKKNTKKVSLCPCLKATAFGILNFILKVYARNQHMILHQHDMFSCCLEIPALLRGTPVLGLNVKFMFCAMLFLVCYLQSFLHSLPSSRRIHPHHIHWNLSHLWPFQLCTTAVQIGQLPKLKAIANWRPSGHSLGSILLQLQWSGSWQCIGQPNAAPSDHRLVDPRRSNITTFRLNQCSMFNEFIGNVALFVFWPPYEAHLRCDSMDTSPSKSLDITWYHWSQLFFVALCLIVLVLPCTWVTRRWAWWTT